MFRDIKKGGLTFDRCPSVRPLLLADDWCLKPGRVFVPVRNGRLRRGSRHYYWCRARAATAMHADGEPLHASTVQGCDRNWNTTHGDCQCEGRHRQAAQRDCRSRDRDLILRANHGPNLALPDWLSLATSKVRCDECIAY